jgi:hypothetical protein
MVSTTQQPVGLFDATQLLSGKRPIKIELRYD